MEQTISQPESEAKEANWSFSLVGLIRVITKPEDFFEQLKNSPKLLVPYIAIVIVSIAAAVLFAPIMQEEMLSSPDALEELQKQSEASGMTIDELKAIGQKFMLGFILFARVTAPLVVALLLMFYGSFIMGGEASFKKILSVTLYSEFLFSIGILLTAILMQAKGGMVTISPAVLVMDQGVESTAFVALSQLSLFHIWQVIVLGAGAKKIFAFSGNKGYIVGVLSIGTIALINITFSMLGQAIR